MWRKADIELKRRHDAGAIAAAIMHNNTKLPFENFNQTPCVQRENWRRRCRFLSTREEASKRISAYGDKIVHCVPK